MDTSFVREPLPVGLSQSLTFARGKSNQMNPSKRRRPRSRFLCNGCGKTFANIIPHQNKTACGAIVAAMLAPKISRMRAKLRARSAIRALESFLGKV